MLNEKKSFGYVIVGLVAILFSVALARTVIINIVGHISVLGIVILIAAFCLLIIPFFSAGVYLIVNYFVLVKKDKHKE